MTQASNLTQTPSIPPAPKAKNPRKPWLSDRGILIAFFVAVCVRWIVSALRELVPDEAYYWVWSRHLALSYYDHPPIVALLIRFGTTLLGQTELGVRWPAGLLAMGSVLIMAALARRMFDDPRPVAFVAVMLFVSPLVNVMGSVMTPDTPACFFQAAALAVAVRILLPAKSPREQSHHGPLWLLFGLFIGLALLSKYTTAIFGLCVFVALLASPEGRRQLKTPWPWLAALLAFAMFTPVIYWNAHHQWASFLFQAQHGLGEGKSSWLRNLGAYLGGQTLVCTPVLFVMVIVAIVVYLRRWKSLPAHLRLLVLSTLLPLIFFALSSVRKIPEANWPVFTYFPGTLLVAQYLMEKWEGHRVAWASLAAKVALVGTIFLHLPEVAWSFNHNLGSPQWDDLFGWRDLAQKVHDQAGYRPVFGQDYHLAAEMSFYLPGHPEVWQVEDKLARSTQYDFLPNRPDPTKYNSIVLVRRALNPPGTLAPPRDRQYKVVDYDQKYFGRTIRRTWIEVGMIPGPQDLLPKRH